MVLPVLGRGFRGRSLAGLGRKADANGPKSGPKSPRPECETGLGSVHNGFPAKAGPKLAPDPANVKRENKLMACLYRAGAGRGGKCLVRSELLGRCSDVAHCQCWQPFCIFGFGLDQELSTKWLYNWSMGLMLGAFCTSFRAWPV